MLDFSDLDADQQACIDFMGAGEDGLICADVGTGKTVISLTAARNALERNEVNRWLVLAPLLVATDTWAQEPGLWRHLQGVDVAIACGDEKQRRRAVESDAPIVVMNYENLLWLLSEYPRQGRRDTLPFDGLICDEVDKLANISTERYKRMRYRIGVFRRRFGLTGTLLPVRLEQIWGQTYMVDGGQSFGRSYTKWLRDNFYPTDYEQRNWRALPGVREQIIATLADLVFRLKAKGLPQVVYTEPDRQALPAEIAELYAELEKNLIYELEDGRSVDAANAAVLSGKLRQLTAGFNYLPPAVCPLCGGVPYKTKRGLHKCRQCTKTIANDIAAHGRQKFDWLDSKLRKLDAQTLIFYQFKEELYELKRRYPGFRHIGGGVANSEKLEAIRLWNEGKIPYLGMHPASAAHGLNLQKSHAHHITLLSMPWSGGMLKQLTGRLARRGNAAKQVFVHTTLFENTIDEDVYEAALGRIAHMERFLNDLEAAAA